MKIAEEVYKHYANAQQCYNTLLALSLMKLTMDITPCCLNFMDFVKIHIRVVLVVND